MFIAKIKALENENNTLIEHVKCQKREIDELKEENSKLKRQLMGERVVSVHCLGCENFIKSESDYWNLGKCSLDCKCKDFTRRER